MAINKKLIHFKKYSDFIGNPGTNGVAQPTDGYYHNIPENSIVFIQDSKQIWTHGTFYPCPYTKDEINELFVGNNITLSDYVEMESPIKIADDDTVNEAFGKIEAYLSELDDLNAILVDTNDVASDPTINDYISPSDLNQKLSEYATIAQVNAKQDTITDLELIRNNASNAVQPTDLSAVATSGSYSDLAGTPVIPVVNNGTLTIQKNDTNVGTFTANQSGNSTINITLSKSDVGLDNVDNTADSSKNVATAVTATKDASGNIITATYATKTELNTHATAIANKQDKNLYFTNSSASSWMNDSTYSDFPYRCDISCSGVTSSMYAEVVFSMTDAQSGNYAPICESGTNIVSIWSKTNTTTTIPTIKISK